MKVYPVGADVFIRQLEVSGRVIEIHIGDNPKAEYEVRYVLNGDLNVARFQEFELDDHHSDQQVVIGYRKE